MFPIDYAGIFKHERTVNLLISYQLESMKQLKKQLPIGKNELALKAKWDQLLVHEPADGVIELTFFNPVLHTSMLYWAALFDKVPIDKMDRILNEFEAYPEGPVAIDKWKTPCHAAA